MGYSILEMVMLWLHQAGFHADVAYPGRKIPQITQSVAAVHIQKVDWQAGTVTVEVNIVFPASMGGTACELEALRAARVLRQQGAACVQSGCRYDGLNRVYSVPVLATFSGISGEENWQPGPGFQVSVDGRARPYVTAVTEAETADHRAEYTMGEALPENYGLGSLHWQVTLEEQLPPGAREPEEPQGEFVLRLETEHKTVIYPRCRWVSVRREHSSAGQHRVYRGIALGREEEEHGTAAV